MTAFVLGIVLMLVAVIGCILAFRIFKDEKVNDIQDEYDRRIAQNRVDEKNKINHKIRIISCIVACLVFILSALLAASGWLVELDPGQYGRVYLLSGNSTELVLGYNFVAPWALKRTWDTTMYVETYTEGDADDDIFGVQTLEKDYIRIVATIGVHIDKSRMDEYISLYGNEQINSPQIRKLLKTIARSVNEKIIGAYTTSEAMSNKKKITEDAEEELKIALAGLPIVLDSYKIDDLQAPQSYEEAIKLQAQLRMEKDNATLQQQVNEQQAAANRIKAEGEAAVAKTQAEADAAVKEIAAKNSAAVKEIEAENAAKVKKIEEENAAEVKKIQAAADAQSRQIKADALAYETTKQADAEATAVVKKGEAEAKSIEAQGAAYQTNPELISLRKAEIEADVQTAWATKWSGYNFSNMSSFSFADLTELLKGLIPTK